MFFFTKRIESQETTMHAKIQHFDSCFTACQKIIIEGLRVCIFYVEKTSHF